MTRYRPDRRRHFLAAVAALCGASALILVLAAPVLVRHARAPRLAVFDVNLLPPPPAREQPPTRPVEAPRPEIVAPRPQVIASEPPVAVAQAAPLSEQREAEPIAPSPSPAPPIPAAASPRAPVTRDLAATVLSAEPPRYPFDSRRKREQGVVVLALVVGTDGRVKTISVSRSSGARRLDDAALAAVRNWRWSPMRVEGVAVEVRGLVEIPFVLREP